MKFKRATNRRSPSKKSGGISIFSCVALLITTLSAVLLYAYIRGLYTTLYISHRESTQKPETSAEEAVATVQITTPDSSPVETKRKERLPFLQQSSEYAYVTLISGIDTSFRYRGFLYNALIMKRALKLEGSTADFIALIGYAQNDTTPFMPDIDLLTSHGIIVHELPRLLNPTLPLSFAEMALLKITPW